MRVFRGILKKSAAEACGTFVFMTAGCGALRLNAVHPEAVPGAVIPLIFGLAICAMIYALGPISGAHFNPAVTAAFAAVHRFPANEILWYWIAQFLGAWLALAFVGWALPDSPSFGAVRLAAGLTLAQALGIEILMTFILMLVIISVATDSRASGTMAGLAIGMSVTFCAYAAGPLTGAAMNPARAFVPAVFEGHFTYLWIYFAGPLAGALAAAFFYEWLRRCEDTSRTAKSAKGCC